VCAELDEADDRDGDADVVAVVDGVAAAPLLEEAADDVPEAPATAAAAGLAEVLAVPAPPDPLIAITVPSPRNALVLTAATTRRARQAGERRVAPGPAGRRAGGRGWFGMQEIVRP
jgi:hypothetical protein